MSIFNLEDVIKKCPKEEKIFVKFTDSCLFNKDIFKKKINSIDSISDNELYPLVKTCYRDMLNDIIRNNSLEYNKAFYNARFLNCFISVIKYENFNISEIIACNRLAYDYIVLKNEKEIDGTIKNLLISIVKIVNKEIINILMNMNISSELSSYIVINRWSSLNDAVNVKRINFFLSAHSDMDADVLRSIYEILFAGKIEPLFISTMLDTYNMEPWITEDFIKMHNNISFVVLKMLEESTIEEIQNILIKYSNIYIYKYNANPNSIRLSIRALDSNEFPRILSILEQLYIKQIYVP